MEMVISQIGKCLTSIYQPCDVVINILLKQIIQRLYSRYVAIIELRAGEQLKISRETLLYIIERLWKKLMTDKLVINSFAEHFLCVD